MVIIETEKYREKTKRIVYKKINKDILKKWINKINPKNNFTLNDRCVANLLP